MAKLTIDDLKKIKERVKKEDLFRSGEKNVKINVHMGTCGIASGAKKIAETFMDEIANSDRDDIMVVTSGCIGVCSREPLATIEIQGEDTILYERLNEAKVRQIFQRHIIDGLVQSDFVMARDDQEGEA